jgi:hypothetical protein
MIRRTLVTLSFLGLLTACGGPGESTDAPEAQPAGATNADIGEVARAYNIVRSKNRAMLNVSVLRESDNTPVKAVVTVKTVNLTGQLKSVTMREITEQEAVYYIGEIPVANRETLIFDISVTPEGVQSASDVRFKRQFFTD